MYPLAPDYTGAEYNILGIHSSLCIIHLDDTIKSDNLLLCGLFTKGASIK